jgi:N-dimethylarginine dimethylaminohydrolase
MNSLVDMRTPTGISSRQYRPMACAIGDCAAEIRYTASPVPHAERPRLLMCAPTHFSFDDSMAAQMRDPLQGAIATRAGQQWQEMRQILGRHATIETMEPIARSPATPFTASAGLLRGNRFVPSRYRNAERRVDEARFTEWFGKRGAEIRNLPPSLRFGGARDALFDETLELLWMGYGQRSELAAAAGLARLLDIDTIPLRIIDAHLQHLDTCFCPLPRGFLLWYPQAFEADSRALVESRIRASRRIAVEKADALALACNAISLGSAIVLHRASGKLKRHLDDAGFTVIETALDEFHKAGGSAKSLALRLQP